MAVSRGERRLGQRHETPNLVVSWRVPRRRFLRTRLVAEPATMLNVSATGAALVGGTVPEFEPGATVIIDCGNSLLRATIARIVPSGEEDTSYYGIQFIDLSPDVLEELLEHANVAPRELLEQYWSNAS